MEHGYEKVLEVQRRCGVSFEEADRAMRINKGDVDKACTYALRRKNRDYGWLKKDIGALSNFFTYRIRISKKDEVKFNIPMGVVMVISLFVLVFSTGGYYRGNALGIIFFCIFAVTVLTGYSLEFTPDKKKEEAKLEKIAKKEKPAEQVFKEYQDDEVKEQDDGFNTIEIE